MTEFAAAAARMAGFAGVLFGWRPGKFWEATPAELGVLIAALRGDEGEAVSAGEFEALRARFPDE